MKYLVFIIISLLSITSVLTLSAQDTERETLKKLRYQSQKAKGKTRVEALNQLSEASRNSQPVSAMKYAQKALSLAKSQQLALQEAKAFKNIGIIYQTQGNYSQALKYFLDALRRYEAEKDQKGIAETLNDIGVVYQNLRNFSKASQYYLRVLEIDKAIKDEKGRASTLNNIGDLYYQQDEYDKALQYYNKSLDIRTRIGDSTGIAVSRSNIGLIYYTKAKYQEALKEYRFALDIERLINNQTGIALTFNSLANTFLKLGQSDSARFYAEKGLELSLSQELDKAMLDAYFTLSEIYYSEGNYEKAFEYQSVYVSLHNEIFNEANDKKIATLQTSYELEKKQSQIDLLNKDRKIRSLIAYTLGIGVLLLLGFAFVLYRGNQQKKKANALLTQQNAEINQQKEEILVQRDAIEAQRDRIETQHREIYKKNENIESSIQYARRIQRAMLPYKERIDEALPYNFIYYRPRDVVSGDFYWFAKIAPRPIYAQSEFSQERVFKGFENEKIVIAAIDCTGHGVPGAFMSMIGDSLLNQIVLDKKITKAAQILEEMHTGIRKALKQSETHNRDGMDMALCVIDPEDKTIEFAGAKNAMIYIQNQRLQIAKANPFSVGGWQESRPKNHDYQSEIISYANAPITFYLYSDGYQDQFGGERNRKYLRRRFRELLYNIHQEPMSYQQEILHQEFINWKGNVAQIDDVLVIGVRLNPQDEV